MVAALHNSGRLHGRLIAWAVSAVGVGVPGACGQSGACCNGTTCTFRTSGAFRGTGVAHMSSPPPGNTTCCQGNFNGVGGLAVQHIFDFLAANFGGCASLEICRRAA